MSKVKVTFQITRFEDNPKGGQNVFITCTLGKRVWELQRWCNYDKPISMEMFKRDLAKGEIFPKDPDDFLAYVKQEADAPFVLDIELT